MLLGLAIPQAFSVESSQSDRKLQKCETCLTSSFSDLAQGDEGESVLVEKLIFRGLNRTDPAWLASVLGLNVPCLLPRIELEPLRRRILSIRIFSSAQVEFFGEKKSGSVDTFAVPSEGGTLQITVEEKWTFIPVLRGQFGGGTPLWVLGAYETNLFGKGLSVGLDIRRYGRAPIGYMIFAKNLDALGRGYFFGGEFRNYYRIRTLYDVRGKRDQEFRADEWTERAKMLWPESFQGLRSGVDLRSTRYVLTKLPLSFGEDSLLEPRFRLQSGIFTRLAYVMETDKISVDNALMDGMKWEGLFGLTSSSEDTGPSLAFESNVFYYKWLGESWNLGLHLFAVGSESMAYGAKTFLGGLDSIRGIPDGEIYGSKAAYANSELSYLLLRRHRFWVQGAVFADLGAAHDDWDKLDARFSFGTGLRFSIPQVYRFMFRVDYAVSPLPYRTESLSVGMNAFFQPHRPNLID